MNEEEIFFKINNARKYNFPPEDFNFPTKKISGCLGQMMRPKSYEDQKAYYAISSDNFFFVTFDQYKNLKDYLGFRSCILPNQEKGDSWRTNCLMYYSRLRGLRFHQMHGRKLIKGFKQEFTEWYESNNYDTELFLLNFHLNALTVFETNRTGTYFFMEDEQFDIDQTYNVHRKQTSVHNQIYTMLWKRLINEYFLKMEKADLMKLIESNNIDIEFVKRMIKKNRKYIINKIKETNNITINDSHILRFLIQYLGYNYAKLANNTPKKFKHREINWFPMDSKKTIIKKTNLKNNELLNQNKDFEQGIALDIWSDFFQEMEDEHGFSSKEN